MVLFGLYMFAHKLNMGKFMQKQLVIGVLTFIDLKNH